MSRVNHAYQIHIGEDCISTERSQFITVFKHEVTPEAYNILLTALQRDCNIRWVVHRDTFYEYVAPLAELIGQPFKMIPMTLRDVGTKTDHLEAKHYWESFNDSTNT